MRILSELAVPTQLLQPLKDRSMTVGDLQTTSEKMRSINETEKPQRSVCFACTSRAILIPTRSEFYEMELHDSLWWSETDYLMFKNSARNELIKYHNENRNKS